MIEKILPAVVASAEAWHDPPGTTLFAEEEALLDRSVDQRRREFTTGRLCARRALAELGVPLTAILPGPKHDPQWPPGITGSITHCVDYRAAAVARTTDIMAVGIDAEPHEALPNGVLDVVARPEEHTRLHELAKIRPEVRWDRLIFSAKESVFKAWFPLTKRWLGFEDALVDIDPASGTFTARLLVPGPVMAGRRTAEFSGAWLADNGVVVTAVAPFADR